MFKKTNSDREPKPNFFTELKKEFGGHNEKFALSFRSFCQDHPKEIFIGMVATMLISAILSFTVIIPMEKKRLEEEMHASAALASKKNLEVSQQLPGNNIGEVITGISKMKSIIVIKRKVDAILAKDKLTDQDKNILNGLLDSLKQNQTELNLKNKR